MKAVNVTTQNPIARLERLTLQILIFSANKRFKRSNVAAEEFATNVKRLLSVFIRFRRFLSVLSVLEAFRFSTGKFERECTQFDCDIGNE